MWQAIGIISFLAMLASLVAIIVGLVIGIARKRWSVLKWSSIACAVAFVLLIVAIAIDSGSDDSQAASASPKTSGSTPAPEPTPTPRPTATPEPTSTPIPTFEDWKSNASVIGYRELFRNNEQYESQNFYFKGEVVQVVEVSRNKYHLRVRLGDIFSDEIIFLSDYSGQRLLEDDIIEFVAESTGLITYTATFGNNVTIPELKAISVRLVSSP